MGNNFHTAPVDTTKWKVSEIETILDELDKGITYQKNIITHCAGDISYNASTGVLTWSGIINILFTREDGTVIKNYISAGNKTIADSQMAYVDLNETNNTSLTMQVATVTGGSSTNLVPVNRLVLAYRNAASDKLYSVYLPVVWHGVSGSTVLGTANQVLGVNSGATAQEYKSIVGTSDEIDVAHTTNQIQIGLVNPLATTKGGTGLSAEGSANQVLGMQGDGSGMEYKTISGAGGITINHAANSIEIDGSDTDYYSGTYLSTGSAWHTLITIPILEQTAMIINADIIAYKLGPLYGAFVIRGLARRVLSSPSVEDYLIDYSHKDDVDWDVKIDVDGSDVIIAVSSDDSGIHWAGKARVVSVTIET